jgi:hypothetical protein
VRKLSDQASIFVMHHMQMLESTGLVQYAKLPPAAMTASQDLAATGAAHADAGAAPPISSALLWLLIAGITGIAALAAVRITRGRRPAIDPRTGPLRS